MIQTISLEVKQRPDGKPVVDLLGRREALDGPVEEAVHEDETGETRPHPHDHLEGRAGVVDQLEARGGDVMLSNLIFRSHGEILRNEQI